MLSPVSQHSCCGSEYGVGTVIILHEGQRLRRPFVSLVGTRWATQLVASHSSSQGAGPKTRRTRVPCARLQSTPLGQDILLHRRRIVQRCRARTVTTRTVLSKRENILHQSRSSSVAHQSLKPVTSRCIAERVCVLLPK